MKNNLRGQFKVLLALILIFTMLLLPFDALALGYTNNGSTPDEMELSATGASTLSGEGSQENPYIIATSDDWDALSESINSSGTDYSGKFFKMTDDITVTTVLGNRPNNSTDSNDNYFSGTFDGDGHELNVNINESGFGAAPFAIAHNATIKNLHVTGTVTSGANHATGLVAASKGRSIYDASSLTIQNVTVSTDISCPSHVAGIVGHAHSADITMENVVFDGSMSASSVQGGMIGWGGLGNGARFNASFKDCVFAGTYNTSAAFYPVAFANGQGTATLINDFYTTSLGSGGSPIAPTGDGQLKLLVATVEKDGAVNYFDNINTAADGSNWTQGSTLKLMTDVTTSSTITVPAGAHTLDLNGHELKRTGATGSDNSGLVITVGDGVNLTVTGPGKITGGSGFHGGGIHVEGNSSLVLDNCEISGNTGHYGGGLYLKNGTITLKNGTAVKNNSATEGFGGSGIYAEGSGTLILEGGTFTNNEIRNNNQYAVFLAGNANVQISGAPVIYDNKYGSTQKNLYMFQAGDQHSIVRIAGALTDGAKIGVGQTTVTGEITSGWKDNMGDADPAKYFTSDNDSYDVFLNKNGEAEIGEYVPFDGSGTEEDPFLLKSADDWDTLADSVLAGKTYDNKFFLLKEDITVSRGIGSADITSSTAPVYEFSGIFDGGGHTLDFVPPADTNANYVAPFSIVKNATIRNLKVTGKITAYNNLSGLVGATRGTLTIENVLSDVDVTGNFVGGFIGHGTSGNITLRSCAFTGDLNGTTLAGGLICWRGPTQWDSSSTSAVHMENCLFAGTVSGSADFHPIGFTQQTNVSQGFSNMWSTLGGKNNGKGFYNYQYQSASYKSTAATVTSGKSSSRPWMGYYDVIECLPVESTFTDAVNAWTDGSILALLTDVTTSSSITVPTGEHTLDLNGHGILMTGNDRVVTINQGASLELNDSDPDRIHYITLTNYRGTAVSDSGEESVSNGNGVIKVTGGYLTGGYRNNSGSHDRCGAGVYNWGTFVMNGGSIVGNTLYNNSGGAIRNSGYFTMNGGTIAFNYASGNGGGVTTYVPGGSQGKMTMNGGEISDNYCGSYGGGIQIAGPIEMTGGSVVRNTAGAGGSGVFYDGKNDRFKLSGNPVIKDNSNNDDLYLGANATFMINGSLTEEADIHVLMNTPAEFTVGWKNIMGNADPSKYFTSANSGYAVILNNNGEAEVGIPPAASVINGETATSYGSLSDAVSAWTAGSTLKLLTDVTTSSTITVPSGAHTLDLNGYNLEAGSTGYSVVTVGSGAELTIDDTSDTVGKITGGSVGQNYGGGVTVDGGTLTLKGGAISGNANTHGGIGNCGGGVHVRNGGKFYMEGGEISGNTSYVGGGVCSDTSATTVSITGGVIKNNKTDRFGSAVWAGRSSSAVFKIGGDAQIIDNVSTWTDDKDGEGTINFTTLKLSGNPTIHGDWKTKGTSAPNTHINLDNDGSGIQRIELDGALTNDSGTPNISISPIYRWNDLKNGKTFVFTKNWKTYMGDADPSEYFKSDNNLYPIFLNSSGEAEIGTPPAACIISGGTTANYSSFSDALNAWTAGSTLKLMADVTTGSTITVPTGTHTLDLNGYTITRTGATGSDNSGLAMTVNNGVDLTVTGPGKITGGKGFHGGGIHVEGNSSLVLDNCEISGNTGHYGGGLYLKNGTITMKNGTVVKENSASEGFGGSGIYAEGGGTLIMDGCTFTQNAIKNNNQYAVFLCGNANIKVSGAPVINDNTYNGAHHDLYMFQAGDQHSTVLIAGALTDGTKITVGQTSGAGVITGGWKDKMGEADPSKYFTSDDSNYSVAAADGEAWLCEELTGVTAEGYEGDYDGEAHGITVSAPDGAAVKYGTTEGSYTLTDNPTYTDAGTYTVYYEVSKTGYIPVYGSEQVKITPIDVTVTITGHTLTVDYDGSVHSADGYDATADSTLYNVAKNITYSGRAEAVRTNVGTTQMGLTADKFSNTNDNFANVTFYVTDGSVTIDPVDAVLTPAPHAKDQLVYNGSNQTLVEPGTVTGGTLYYALGSDERIAPSDSQYSQDVPVARDVGNYYIWYTVIADSNHNDLAPACVKVTLAEEGWTTVSGRIYDENNNPVSNATVSLTIGSKTVDQIVSGSDGGYYFTAPPGLYNIVVKYDGATVTDMIDINESTTYDIGIFDANTDSFLNIVGFDSNIVVGGLNKEAEAVRASKGVSSDKNVTVSMTVTPIAGGDTDAAAAIEKYASDRNVLYYDFEVEETVDMITTYLDRTQTVLEIAIPCSFVNKQELMVYTSDGSSVETLTESDSKAAGTYRVDTSAGLVYIYTDEITTYALGYKPYYSVTSDVSLGSYTGVVSVTLTKDGDTIYELNDVSTDNISFRGVPKGTYSMTITWTDGAENTITTPFEIN